MSDEDSTPTKPGSGTFLVFADRATELSERCKAVAQMKLRIQILHDTDGAKRALEYAQEFDGLAERFSNWPNMLKETVDQERPVLVARLLELQRRAEELFRTLPGAKL